LNKIIITKWKGTVLTITRSEKEIIEISAESEESPFLLGNIYIGKVQNIVKNINAAFVDIGNGQIGYFSLTDACIHHASGKSSDGRLRAGDEILVQIEREAVKTKAPVLTGNLNLAGRYCVLTAGKNHIGFSSKISDTQWKKEIKPLLEIEKGPDFGIIVRTNAAKVPPDVLLAEIRRLKETLEGVMENGRHRTCYSLLYQSTPAYVSGLRDSLSNSLEAIITDDSDIYEEIHKYLTANQPEDLNLLKLYDDPLLPLGKLYSIEKTMTEALGKRVWLKSGGYLIIEHTEALTVIDINTGKYAGKKTPHDTIMKINLEAAEEIGRQLRLRNLSGIILIDFIDMETEEDKAILMDRLNVIFSRDPVKTSVVDITKLNLVEITRKKIRKPLYEQIAQMKEMSSS
jgi:ribonuclease G